MSTSDGNSKDKAEKPEILFSANSIRVIAQSVGVPSLGEEAALYLSTRMTKTVKKVVEDAAKFMNHAKRTKLQTSDIDSAMKLHKMEPLYGYLDDKEKPFRGVYSGKPLFFVEEKECDLDDIIRGTLNEAKVPLEPSLFSYWIAKRKNDPSIEPFMENSYDILVPNKPIETKKPMEEKAKETAVVNLNQLKTHSWQTVAVKNLSIDDISTETQVFYKEITEACVGCDEVKRGEALRSLANYTGLHEMMPRISTFIKEGVRINIVEQNLAILIYLMRMAKALLENRSIYIQEYLHEIIPSVLSCIVSKELCVRSEYDNHWALRNFSARLLAQICRLYSNPINKIQERVINALNNAFLLEPIYLHSVYGSISGFIELGPDMIKTYILPRLPRLSEIIDQQGYLASKNPVADRVTIDKLRTHVAKNCALYLKQMRTEPESLHDYIRDYGSLGAQLFEAVENLRKPPQSQRNSLKDKPSSSTSTKQSQRQSRVETASHQHHQQQQHLEQQNDKENVLVNQMTNSFSISSTKQSKYRHQNHSKHIYERSRNQPFEEQLQKLPSTSSTSLLKRSHPSSTNLSFQSVFAAAADAQCNYLEDSMENTITVTTSNSGQLEDDDDDWESI